MKQTATIISTYAADISGICSAMYELGGMTVMHDASGCNSTYNTHDEPRWYDMDSLVFISGLSETEAILGDDGKLIHDTIAAAQELHPRFITLGGTPIPMMTGVDFPAVARRIEQETGITTFGLNTDGMHSYISGISKAYTALAERICIDAPKTEQLSVNLLGATPLDFSINGTIQEMRKALEEKGIEVHAIWTMDTQFEKIETSAAVHVNLVISACGLPAAKILQKRFGTPYVIGTPCGDKFTEKIVQAIKAADADGQNRNLLQSFPDAKTVIIGESVTALSLANALHEETGRKALVLCAVDAPDELFNTGCIPARDETELIPCLKQAEVIIADPMYRPICPKTAAFIALPHEGFSGRIYRDQIPQLVSGLDKFIEKGGLL